MATNYGVPESKSSIVKRDTVTYHGSPENLPPFAMTYEHNIMDGTNEQTT